MCVYVRVCVSMYGFVVLSSWRAVALSVCMFACMALCVVLLSWREVVFQVPSTKTLYYPLRVPTPLAPPTVRLEP